MHVRTKERSASSRNPDALVARGSEREIKTIERLGAGDTRGLETSRHGLVLAFIQLCRQGALQERFIGPLLTLGRLHHLR